MVIFWKWLFNKVVVVEFSIEGLCKIFPQKGLLCTMDHEHTTNSYKQPRLRQKLKTHKNKKDKTKTQNSKNQQIPKTQLKPHNFFYKKS
jgi:hypothetical protein